MIFMQRQRLKQQAGKCKDRNSEISVNIWPDRWSAKPNQNNLVVVAYCKFGIWSMWQKYGAVTEKITKANFSLAWPDWKFCI